MKKFHFNDQTQVAVASSAVATVDGGGEITDADNSSVLKPTVSLIPFCIIYYGKIIKLSQTTLDIHFLALNHILCWQNITNRLFRPFCVKSKRTVADFDITTRKDHSFILLS